MWPKHHADQLLFAEHMLRVFPQADASVQMCGSMQSDRGHVSVLSGHDAGRLDVARVPGDPDTVLGMSDCALADAMTGWTIRPWMVDAGSRLFLRLIRTGYVSDDETRDFFWTDGSWRGVPDGMNVWSRGFLVYLTCVTLASKAHVSRSMPTTVGRRLRMALRTLGASSQDAMTLWTDVLSIEYEVLDALDWRVIEVYQEVHQDG